MSKKNYDAILNRKNFVLWLALKHHITHKRINLDFREHKFLKQIYIDQSPYLVIIKSTQCGISEYLLVRALGHAINGMNVFYVFPTDTLVNRFVRERLDKSINYTDYYRSLEKQIKEETTKRAESMKLKDIGEGNIAFVGSNSEASFTEYPADEVIIDELDQCNQKNIKMAPERLSHSEYRWQIKVSNPTYEGLGIDEEFKKTNQMEWHIKADCGHWVNLDWEKHIVRKIDDNNYAIRDGKWKWDSNRDIYPICHKCEKPVNRKGPGAWVATKDLQLRGLRINKLFSGTTTILEILNHFQDGLTDDDEMQRVYNADFGKAYTAEGAKISRKLIEECVGSYGQGPEKGVCITGIDIGSFYNFLIMRILPDGRFKVLLIGKTKETKQLISTLKEYNVHIGIIDGAYDTREAKRIASKIKLMFLCYFGNVKKDTIDLQARMITVQRTPCLDAVKELHVLKSIIYPANTMGNEEFINQMTASTRVFNKEKKQFGKIGAYEWVEGNKPDHWFLACGYGLIAKRLLVLLQQR